MTLTDLKGPTGTYNLHYGRCMGRLFRPPYGTTPTAVITNKNKLQNTKQLTINVWIVFNNKPTFGYLIVNLVFSHLGFWSGNFFLIAHFPDHCLLVPFRIILMSNARAIDLDKAIPLKSKTANNNEHYYNLPLGIRSIAISLKAQVLSVSLIVWK